VPHHLAQRTFSATPPPCLGKGAPDKGAAERGKTEPEAHCHRDKGQKRAQFVSGRTAVRSLYTHLPEVAFVLRWCQTTEHKEPPNFQPCQFIKGANELTWPDRLYNLIYRLCLVSRRAGKFDHQPVERGQRTFPKLQAIFFFFFFSKVNAWQGDQPQASCPRFQIHRQVPGLRRLNAAAEAAFFRAGRGARKPPGAF